MMNTTSYISAFALFSRQDQQLFCCFGGCSEGSLAPTISPAPTGTPAPSAAPSFTPQVFDNKADLRQAIIEYNAPEIGLSINDWDVSRITDFSQLFEGMTSFNEYIGLWDTAAATNMHRMFLGASAFNQFIGSWRVASVTDMSFMFYDASAFDESLLSWDTGAVTNMNRMFGNAVCRSIKT